MALQLKQPVWCGVLARITAAESERMQQAILAAAVQEIASGGYAGMRIQAIARRVGRTSGAVYGRFADKEELAIAAVRHMRDKILLPAVASAMQDVRSPIDALEALSATMASVAEHTPGGQLAVARLAIETAHADTPLGNEVRSLFEQFATVLMASLNQAQAQGLVRAELDPHKFAHAVLGLPVAFMAVAQMFPDRISYADMEQALRTVLTRGISQTEDSDTSTSALDKAFISPAR